MLIEKFIIYKYDNVFYTKEELEQMGFIYMCSREDFVCIKENTPDYEITAKSRVCESLHSIQDYLSFDEKHLTGKFLYDFGDHGLILDVEKYYGIRYKNQDKVEKAQLFSDENECFGAYLQLNAEIQNMFEAFSHRTADMYNNQSIEMLKQERIKETRQKVLSLINKKEK